MSAGRRADVVSLWAAESAAAGRRIAWTHAGEDLNVNLVILAVNERVDEHVNSEVDVLIAGMGGDGVVTVDGTDHPLSADHLLIVPKGSRRSIPPRGGPLTYLTCHRRRAGLWPR